MADSYYLYQHKDPVTDMCMYIGMGSHNRVNKTYQRNSNYMTYFKDIVPKIEVIRKFTCKKDASSAERNLINLIRPKLNIVMTSYRKDSLEKRIKLSLSHGGIPFNIFEKGTNIHIGRFINHTEAGKACGVGRTSIQNVLNGCSKSLRKHYIVKEVQ